MRRPVILAGVRWVAVAAMVLVPFGAGSAWAGLPPAGLGLPPAGLGLPPAGATAVQQAGQQNGFPPPAQQGNNPQMPGIKRDTDESPLLKSAEERQALARNDERQKRLVADTDKLLALATQLHEDVAKTNKNVLSIDVVRRSQEIEKLAHDIRERMKG